MKAEPTDQEANSAMKVPKEKKDNLLIILLYHILSVSLKELTTTRPTSMNLHWQICVGVDF